MSINQLHNEVLSLDQIYLDTDNPRFWDTKKKGTQPIAEKILDPVMQEKTRNILIKDYGVEDLINSIIYNGFLPLDRIVVKKIVGNEGKYVVVEGNRRTAALKTIAKRIEEFEIDIEGIDQPYLNQLLQSIQQIEVLVYDGTDNNISWILQGVRHISGIKEWEPAQQAKLLAERIEAGASYTQAGGEFGIDARKAGKLYRTYKVLNAMFEHEEFKDKAENKFYSLFEAALSSQDVSKWLGWNKPNTRFEDDANLDLFYSWISPCTDAPSGVNQRRIHDPKHIKSLAKILTSQDFGLLDKINEWDLSIEQAAERATHSPKMQDYSVVFKKIKTLVDELFYLIKDNPSEILNEIGILNQELSKLETMSKSLKDKG